MEIAEAIRVYLGIHEQLSSVYTLRQYRLVMQRFSAFLAGRAVTDTSQLTLEHLRAWVGYLQEAKTGSNHRHGSTLDPTSVHHYAMDVKIFCRWLEREGILDPPLTQRWQIPADKEKHPEALSPDEARQLLAAVMEQPHRGASAKNAALTARDQAIVTLLIDSGLRRSELTGLRLGDVNYADSVVLVSRKGGRRQAVPVSEAAMDTLDSYLMLHRAALVAPGSRPHRTDAVFLSTRGTALSPSGVSTLFRRLRSTLGGRIDKQVSAHAMRRYMATTQLALGRGELHVMRQMGHSSLSMTNRYARLSITQLRASHETYSPLRAAVESKPARTPKRYYHDEESE